MQEMKVMTMIKKRQKCSQRFEIYSTTLQFQQIKENVPASNIRNKTKIVENIDVQLKTQVFNIKIIHI